MLSATWQPYKNHELNRVLGLSVDFYTHQPIQAWEIVQEAIVKHILPLSGEVWLLVKDQGILDGMWDSNPSLQTVRFLFFIYYSDAFGRARVQGKQLNSCQGSLVQHLLAWTKGISHPRKEKKENPMAKTLWLLKWFTSPTKISLLIAELLLETQGSYPVWVFSRGSPCTLRPVCLVSWPLGLHCFILCKNIHEGDTIFFRIILKREIQLNKRIFFPHLSVLQNATTKSSRETRRI